MARSLDVQRAALLLIDTQRDLLDGVNAVRASR